ncbi:MAG TPA: AMP-binding protein, partial [Actinomycetes bacterium]
MGHAPITKSPDLGSAARLVDYGRERAAFRWSAARALLDGLPGGGLNIAHEAVDRHAHGERADHPALRFVDSGSTLVLSYAELARRTNRFANVLAGLGVGPGDRVFTLLGRVPELYVAVLGALKHRAVVAPLFSAFGPEPVRQRLHLGDGMVLVTTTAMYRKKVAPVREELPALKHVLLVRAGDEELPEGTTDLAALMAEAADDYRIGPTDPEDMALLHFTSGTTGLPKGAVHVHGAVLAHHVTAAYALDLRPDDVFWCTADPGWITGTSYGVIAPLTHGVTVVVENGPFDARRWYRLLAEEHVTVWYTAPTAIRMLMRAGAGLAHGFDLSALRHVASVGEPLNPEGVVWGLEAFGMPIHDNWWQTETGAIMISNYPSMDIRPGSMGRPMPGIEAGVLARGDDGRALVRDGRVTVLTEPGAEGELALRPGWPSMFRGYLHDDERYRRCFVDGWYLTGDVARRDEDGYFWFVGRADDVIKSAGHLIGPFEVESV